MQNKCQQQFLNYNIEVYICPTQHHIIDTLATCIPNNEQITIPDESHDLGRLTKPKLFNGKVIEFISKYA